MGKGGSLSDGVIKKILLSYTYVAIWIFLSFTVIVYNKYILDKKMYNWPFPITLTMIHMAFCSSLAVILIKVFKVVEPVSMSRETYIRSVVPIGALYSLSLWLSNSAYIYLSVSFIQMLKALMPVAVYSIGVLLKKESFKSVTMTNMLSISFGVAIAAYGEAKFDTWESAEISATEEDRLRPRTNPKSSFTHFIYLQAPSKRALLYRIFYKVFSCTFGGGKIMLFHKLSRLGSRIVKELPRERHFSMCRMRILQRSYGQYLPSSPMPQRQTMSFQEALFLKNPKFCTSFSTTSEKSGEETEKINVIFVDKDGEEIHIKVPVGMNILEAAHENDIELEGACECSLACSTCHVIVMDTEYYNKLEEPTDEENDMLDLAFGLTETSRLGCQVIAKPELDGIRLAIPSATRNFAVDGFVPKPH